MTRRRQVQIRLPEAPQVVVCGRDAPEWRDPGVDAGGMTDLAKINVGEHGAQPRQGPHPASGAPDARPPAGEELGFRPEVFFAGRTVGGGAVRNPFGRIVRRCFVTTEGVGNGGHGSIQFHETFAFDDGEVDVWRWAMTAGRDGRYVAAEASAGVGITGERRDGDYVLEFRRPVGRARGFFAPHFATRFTLLAPDLALKHVRITVLGLPVGTLTAVHRRLES